VPLFAPRNIALLVIASAPVAMSAQATTAAATPSGAVEEFMRAVADSNLGRVAQLWGNAKGPASRTHMPKSYEKQIVIIQAMIRGVQVQTLGDVPGSNGMRTVTTQLTNHGCKVTIPVNVVKAREGWLVHDFKLDDAAEVNKPCDTSRRPGNPGL
jgi:hypothetical protein